MPLADAPAMRWSALQPLLVAEGIGDLLALMEAGSPAGAAAAAYCRRLLAQPREVLDPPPLVTGDDLLAHGIPSGPRVQDVCCSASARPSWTGKSATKEEALAMVEKWRGESGEWRGRVREWLNERSRLRFRNQRRTSVARLDLLMDKKVKKKTHVLQQRIQALRQQLAGAKKQLDDPDELKSHRTAACRRRSGTGAGQRRLN